MGKLTPEAEAAIADAVRIVREDRFESFVKDRWPKFGGEPPKDTPKDDPTPPKRSDNDPPKDTDPPKEKRRSAYWGILDDDED